MNTTQQPNALRLAQHLEQFRSFPDDLAAAAELRSQHARIAELEAQLSAIGEGGVEPLRKPPAAQAGLPVPPVPPFAPLAWRKLDDLLAQGFRITGYSIERPVVDDWSPKRGFITHGGMVG